MKFCIIKAFFIGAIAALLFVCNPLNAQSINAVRFESLTTQQGLSRALVKAMEMDDFGMLWVATENGLNRFDGYRFEVFRNEKNNPRSLPDNNIISLLNAGKNGLIIGTHSGILARYNFLTDDFEQLTFTPDVAEAFSMSEPDFLAIDSNEVIWIATTNGLFAYRIADKKTWHFHPGNSGLKSQYIKHVFIDSRTTMWLATDAGLARVDDHLNPDALKIVTVNNNSLPSPYAKRIAEDNEAQIWVGSDGGLSLFHRNEGVFLAHFKHIENDPLSLANNYIKAMVTDNHGNIWIGHDMGVSVFNPAEMLFTNHEAGFDDVHGLINNYVKCLLADENDIIWIGTDLGISYYNPFKEPFRSIVQKPGETGGLKGNLVYGIWEDSPDSIWLATNNGLHLWNSNNGYIKVFQHYPDIPGTINSNLVRSVIRHSSGALWIGTDMGLNEMIIEKDAKVSFKNIGAGPVDGKSLNNNFVVTIKEISDGKLWVGTWGGGVNILNPETMAFSYLSETPDENGLRLRNNKIATLFEDSKRQVWLRSSDIFDLNTNKIIPFPFDDNIENINFFFEDHLNRIWIGTSTNGLHYFDPADKKLHQLTQHTLLREGVVVSMLQDEKNQYWIAVNKQLVRLDSNLTDIHVFDKHDGLQGGDFSNEAAFFGSDGKMYFGGSPGVSFFKPEDIFLNTNKIRVYLTGLKLNNKLQKPEAGSILDTAMISKRRLVLSHNHRELVIEFVGINYTNSLKNHYAFKIEGLQSEWVHTDAEQRSASYFRLPPGNYVFKVKGANNSNIWNEEPAELEIVVLPPWYQLWWVRVLSVLLLALAIYLFVLFRTNKLKKQKLLLEQKVIARTFQLQNQKAEIELKNKQLEDASKAKSEFLANMSHEIRTPLNGVIGFTDLVLKTDLSSTQKEYLTIVGQSAEGLLNIINDILDFSKIEAGKLELFIEKADIHEIGSQSVDIVAFQAHSKDLEILLNMPLNLPRFIYTDIVRLKQVLINLLSNAVKFTNNGEIELKIQMLDAAENGIGTFRFGVRDTGIGINPDKLSLVLEAFTQEDSSTTKRFGGTGLGLTISNRLLGLMGSQLQIESEPGKGSNFYFDVILKCEDGLKNQSEPLQWIKKVLIVDDNQNNRTILSKMLDHFGIMAEEALDGTDALQQLKVDNDYDLIFMDYHMPEINGLDVIKKMQEADMPLNPKTKIILWHSSSDDEEIARRCESLGVKVRMVKPVKLKNLFETLVKIPHQDDEGTKPEIIGQIIFSGKYHILLVEDNPVNLLLAKTILKKILPDSIIHEAHNGLEAVEFCTKQLPDLIFMDIQMPLMNGYEATTKIRLLDDSGAVPILALTAGNVKGEKEKCFALGMNDFLAKPVVEENFTAAIKKWLNPAIKVKEKAKPAVAVSQRFTIETLKEDLGDDPVFLREFLVVLQESLQKSLVEVRQFIEENDLEALRAAAHKLKGTAFSIQMNSLAVTAAKLEKIHDSASPEARDSLIEIENQINNILPMVTEELKNYLN
jgi:signal transduction histidine kinase/CheY-like chemotaxis protein/ligand-binding sensor domain-containing protein